MTLDDALDLIVDLVAALDDVQVEFEMLEEARVPLSGAVLKQLEERDAMAATLRRLPARLRSRAAEVYREELSRCTRTDDGPAVRVNPDTKAHVAEVSEALRRRVLGDRDLDHALRGLLLRSDFAGC